MFGFGLVLEFISTKQKTQQQQQQQQQKTNITDNNNNNNNNNNNINHAIMGPAVPSTVSSGSLFFFLVISLTYSCSLFR